MLKIYGVSDDLVELEGIVQEEIGGYNCMIEIVIGDMENGGVKVVMRYAPEWIKAGVWSAEIAPLEEDIQIPWSIAVGMGGRGYSAEVTIDCPEGTPVRWSKKRF